MKAGEDWIENRVVELRDYAAAKLRERGCELLWNPDQTCAGIVSFRPQSGDAKALYQKLGSRFALSLRADRTGEFWIRVSPHWMNTKEDIDALAAAI